MIQPILLRIWVKFYACVLAHTNKWTISEARSFQGVDCECFKLCIILSRTLDDLEKSISIRSKKPAKIIITDNLCNKAYFETDLLAARFSYRHNKTF